MQPFAILAFVLAGVLGLSGLLALFRKPLRRFARACSGRRGSEKSREDVELADLPPSDIALVNPIPRTPPQSTPPPANRANRISTMTGRSIFSLASDFSFAEFGLATPMPVHHAGPATPVQAGTPRSAPRAEGSGVRGCPPGLEEERDEVIERINGQVFGRYQNEMREAGIAAQTKRAENRENRDS